jgi:Protein of unknown function (DUF3616)
MRLYLRIIALLALAGAALGGGPAAAQSDKAWKVDGRLLGADQKKSKDVSGIACMTATPPAKCLVIDDEVTFAQLVIVTDGLLIAGDTIPLADRGEGKLSLDGEGVAFAPGPAGTGVFYVVGSHGHPRDRHRKLDPERDANEIAMRTAASSKLIRLPVDSAQISDMGRLVRPTSGRTEIDLRFLIQADPALAPLRPFLGKRLEEESRGFNIEGIAAVQGRLYVGARGPVFPGERPGEPDRAAIFSFEQDAPFLGQPPQAELRLLPLGPKRGVRDLAALGGDLLILAGPAYEPNTAPAAGKPGEYAIYRWDRVAAVPTLLKDLPQFSEDGEPLKPEAILPLGSRADGTLDVLVLFDGATEGGPRLVQIGK